MSGPDPSDEVFSIGDLLNDPESYVGREVILRALPQKIILHYQKPGGEVRVLPPTFLEFLVESHHNVKYAFPPENLRDERGFPKRGTPPDRYNILLYDEAGRHMQCIADVEIGYERNGNSHLLESLVNAAAGIKQPLLVKGIFSKLDAPKCTIYYLYISSFNPDRILSEALSGLMLTQ